MATYLAFVAHRDDELNIAGTLMRLLGGGHRCVVACITNGSRGGLADRTEDERKRIARSEFEASTAIIGCETRWLDINEHDFPTPEGQTEARRRIFRILCEVDPDCLILHPGPPLDKYDYHEHHWIASRLPYAESYSASNPNYARPLGLTPMSGVPPIYHMCPIGTPMAMGFSTITCLPASSAGTANRACMALGVRMLTTSMRSSASSASKLSALSPP